MEKMQEKNLVLRITEEECIKLEEELEKLRTALKRLRNRRQETILEREWRVRDEKLNYAEEQLIIMEIEKVSRFLNSVVRVEKEESLHNVVNLGDVVELNLIFDEEEQERLLVRLGSVRKGNVQDDIETISVESPLGKAIYGQEVGETVPYPVNGNMFQAEILSVINEDVKEVESAKTK